MKTTDAIKYWETAFDKSCRNNSYQSSGKIEYEDAVWTALEALRAQAGLEDTEPLQQSETIDTEPLHNPDDPFLAKLLGVKVGEWFRVRDTEGGWDADAIFHIDAYGKFVCGKDPGSSIALCCAIRDPGCIVRVPRLTELERAICKAMGAKWVTRDECADDEYVDLRDEKPELFVDGCYSGEHCIIGRIQASLMPSVHPGDCICVEAADYNA